MNNEITTVDGGGGGGSLLLAKLSRRTYRSPGDIRLSDFLPS